MTNRSHGNIPDNRSGLAWSGFRVFALPAESGGQRNVEIISHHIVI